MPGLTISTPQIYLSKQHGELVLRQGVNPDRLKHADQRVLVVGGGVTGLTVRSSSHPTMSSNNFTDVTVKTAWALLDAGYSVTVVSDRWASLKDRITSQIAGAL